MIDKIINYVETHEKIKVISFDIFDTLLLRTVSEPTQVFEVVYAMNKELFPDFVDAESWKSARIQAEKKAREIKRYKTDNREVILQDIYERIPCAITNVVELMKAEVECEKQVCFLNQEMYTTLQYLREKNNMKIVLASDMYLGTENIMEILDANGLDKAYIDSVYVSCDCQMTKFSGRLYQHIMEQWKVLPGEILHIGDNQLSDNGAAKRLGMHTYFYGLISEAKFKYPFLDMENLIYGPICKEIYPLRIIAAEKGKDLGDRDRFWFNIGAMILGPLLTYVAEWVLDQGERNDICRIRPMMREWKFLTELLNVAAAERETKFSIEPFYISRLALFKANLVNVTAENVKHLLNTIHITCGEVFKVLGIEDLDEPFREYKNKSHEEWTSIHYEGITLMEALEKYLLSENIMKAIRENNSRSNEKLIEYLKQLKLTDKSITFDLGWRGNIQKAINDVLRGNQYKPSLLHLYVVSMSEVAVNAIEGCDIRGFLGNIGKNTEEVSEMYPLLIEMFFLGEEGSTVGYEYSDKVYPVTQSIEYPKWQVNAMKVLQRGVLEFQKLFLEQKAQNKRMSNLISRPEDLSHLLGRLCCYPLIYEAEQLRTLVLDQNFGSSSLMPIIRDTTIKKRILMKDEEFYFRCQTDEMTWYAGLNALSEKAYYYRHFFIIKRRYMSLALLLMSNWMIKECRNEKFVVVGAGQNTKAVLTYISSMGELPAIEGIADNNMNLQHTQMLGIPVYSVGHEFRSKLFFITTTNRNFYDELNQQLLDTYGEGIKIIGYFGGIEA